MPTHAVLFDMDGVLIDSYEAHWDSWRDSTEDRGYQIDRDLFAHLFGQPFGVWVEELTGGAIDEAAAADWYRDKEARYRTIVQTGAHLMPGADDLVRALSEAGFGTGIGSAGPRENVELIQQLLPHGHLMGAIKSADDVAEPKPAPDVFLAGAEALGVAPARCAVIEDSTHGLEAAAAAGMTRIGLTGTCTRDQLAPYCDLVVDAHAELNPERLKNLIDSTLT